MAGVPAAARPTFCTICTDSGWPCTVLWNFFIPAMRRLQGGVVDNVRAGRQWPRFHHLLTVRQLWGWVAPAANRGQRSPLPCHASADLLLPLWPACGSNMPQTSLAIPPPLPSPGQLLLGSAKCLSPNWGGGGMAWQSNSLGWNEGAPGHDWAPHPPPGPCSSRERPRREREMSPQVQGMRGKLNKHRATLPQGDF